MNFVEIVINYYLHITSHVSHAITSCTHYTSYFLLNLIHNIVCEFVLAIQVIPWFWCKMCLIFKFWGQKKKFWKYCFWKIWVEFKCFWKTFKLIPMHFIHEILCFEWFMHKLALFFKNLIFPDFRSIEVVARPIEIAIKNLVWICLARSVLDWCSIDWIYFSIDRSSISTDRYSNSECFKKSFLTCSSLFSKLFKHFSHYFSLTNPI